MEILPSTTLEMPSVNAEKVLLDLGEIYRLEIRQPEISTVTRVKAPELLNCFREGYSLLSDIIKKVVEEKNRFQIEVDKRKALIVLDIAPEILKSKGLYKNSNPAGSSDLRQAVIDSDEDYCSLLDKLNQVTAIESFLKQKQHAFEMCFSATKKIYENINFAQPVFESEDQPKAKLLDLKRK